jgi:hypothetical protein
MEPSRPTWNGSHLFYETYKQAVPYERVQVSTMRCIIHAQQHKNYLNSSSSFLDVIVPNTLL